jgi:EAL domain-containing protein (putative c-di-GMP-specific phosphodiesterase class I)
VRSIVDIARGKGIRTVGEGVEDEEALDLLRRYGVDLAQGFHIARPRARVGGARAAGGPRGRSRRR